MTKLHEAYETRNKKINKIEGLKTLKTPQSVYDQLEQICAEGYENLKDEDSKFFLKCFGLFDKGEGEFMIRLRIAGGQLEPQQAATIGEIAQQYSRDYIDITTRQQIELRYIPFAALAEVLQRLDTVGITTFQTGIDNFRNVVTSPFDGYDKTQYIACMPIIEALQTIFLKREEWIGILPRKFNTAILGSGTNDCNIYGHDCCFLPAQRDGIYGFNLYLGGKVAVQAQESGLFIKPDELTTVFEALIHLFKTYGFRDNRNKNRLHFLVESVGMENFAKALAEQSGLNLAESGELLLTTEHCLGDDGCVELAEGKKALLFAIPSGIFSGSDLIETAALARSTGSHIRLSIEQSFYLINDASKIGQLKASALYTKYKKFHNVYFTHQIACAGTETCSFGVIPNKPDAIEMAEFLDRELPMESGKIRMHWSACPKGCGIHGIADIGFEGCKAKDAEDKSCFGVHIFVGGKASFEAVEARQVFKAVPLTEAKEVVKKIVALYVNERLEGESFELYDTRVLQALSVDQLRDKIMQ
ncbi:ferredoxin--nitrite reductase [Sulfurimonas sp. HSL3-7]|uniref:ferredoxin--nitrite reductase n=1 Tax=Sulfonitrofixus jiaomeiensis TaxID=3131938 RepID=UPI0031FA38C5